MLATLIGAFVVVLIGFSLLPAIAEQINMVMVNQTGAVQTLGYLIPGFFALAILTMGIGMAYVGLRNAGLIEEAIEDGTYEEEYKAKPHRQTYEEYVAERLRVEKMMKYGWIGRFI